jgi:hypothetical protein
MTTFFGSQILNSVQNWCTANHIRLDDGKIKIAPSSRRANVMTFNNVLYNSAILHTDILRTSVVFLYQSRTSISIFIIYFLIPYSR